MPSKTGKRVRAIGNRGTGDRSLGEVSGSAKDPHPPPPSPPAKLDLTEARIPVSPILREGDLVLAPGETLQIESRTFEELGMQRTRSGAVGFKRYKIFDNEQRLVRHYIEYTYPERSSLPPIPDRGLPMPITNKERGVSKDFDFPLPPEIRKYNYPPVKPIVGTPKRHKWTEVEIAKSLEKFSHDLRAIHGKPAFGSQLNTIKKQLERSDLPSSVIRAAKRNRENIEARIEQYNADFKRVLNELNEHFEKYLTIAERNERTERIFWNNLDSPESIYRQLWIQVAKGEILPASVRTARTEWRKMPAIIKELWPWKVYEKMVKHRHTGMPGFLQ